MQNSRDEALRSLTAPGEPYELTNLRVGDQPQRWFVNAPENLGQVYAETRSDLPFLVYKDERMTFEQTWKEACALAHAMRNDFDVKSGDRVAISMRNYPEWMIAFMAITSIGAVAVALNALWQPDEMAYGLKDSGAVLLVADQERLERLGAGPKVERLKVIAVRTTTPLPMGARAFVDAVAPHRHHDAMPEGQPGLDDNAIMLYTSGSTGHPKGAASTHRNVLAALLSWELDGAAAVEIGLLPEPDPDAPQGATLLGIPLFHVTGLHAVFLMSFRSQRRLVSMYKWDVEEAAELIEQERVTSFVGPAAVTGDLVNAASRLGRDLSSLTAVGGGGAPRAPEQVRSIADRFDNARPQTGWGMTETNAIGTSIAAQDYLDRPESSGRVSAVLDIRIADEDGNTLPPRHRGELQIRGASVIKGYWNRPDANAETFVDGWMRTGDVAYLDEDGFLFIVDRIKDVVIRGGENIGCGAIESALLEHPEILEASVYGVPEPRLGEEVGATIYVRNTVDHEEILSFLATRLAKFEIPRYVYQMHEPLPRIATGKINKRLLREEASARWT